MKNSITLYSDGACSGNPGPGGYGAIIKFSKGKETFSRGFQLTTNNRMELLGIIEPLECLKDSYKVHIVTDSRYVSDSINKNWLIGWSRRGWQTSSKKPAKNIDLWKRFLVLLDKHDISIEWIKGHNSHTENDQCDQLAVTARLGKDLGKDNGYIEKHVEIEDDDDIFG